MYTRPFICLLLLSQVGLLGCHHRCHKLWNNVCRTVKREPMCFDYCDRSAVFHEMACCYWSQNMKTTPCSEHFRSGFLDGFSDYLHHGGTGQAPVLPPRRYWEPSGGMSRQNVIAEWRTGFGAGADSAKESGMRQQIVMPYDGLPVSQDCIDPEALVVMTDDHLYSQSTLTETPAEDMAAPIPSEYSDVDPILAVEYPETTVDSYEESPWQLEGEESVIGEGFIEAKVLERVASPDPTIIYLSQDVDESVR